MQPSPSMILVVDDHAPNRLKLAMAVKALGHEAELAENGLEALDKLRTGRFDLVLLDIVMPQLDGYEVLRRMKGEPRLREIPVIVVTSLDELESAVACIELGAEDYLPKNFDPLLLRARINSSLEKKHLRDAVVRQMEFIREVFGKYVPDSIVEKIVENKGNLAPNRTRASMVYTDIAGFTTLLETMPAERAFRMLDEYLSAVLDCVARHGGVLNGFHGDGILAVFNVPVEDPQHADSALQAAIAIEAATGDRAFADVPIVTRIGVNTGEVITGTVGSGNSLSYTILGDPVNVCARLEKLNKDYGTRMLVSGHTVDALTGSYR
ncbi:MAG: response regulator [Geminicoccaceae bacterium]